MGFSLSTSWNAYRYTDAKKMLFEIRALGYEEAELSFNLTSEMVELARKLVEKKRVKISSVHNFCPVPDGVRREIAMPDYYSLASLNDDERQKAVDQTKKTIEIAYSLKAKAVVLHSGRVEIHDRMRDLIKLYNEGRKDFPEFIQLRDDVIRERKEHAPAFLDNTLKSLEVLAGYAQGFGIKLGIETRFYCREIPSFEEIGIILNKFKGANVYYWHDTGHAQVMENLGFTKHKDFLDAYAKDMCGIHLHGVAGCFDHQAPIRGEFDFNILKPYLKPDTIKVVEAHYPASPRDIKESKKFLEKIFDA